MSKKVATGDHIIVAGHDVSEWVTRWAIVAKMNDIVIVDLDFLNWPNSPLAFGRITRTKDFLNDRAEILLYGTDISGHVSGWEVVNYADRPELIRLHLHADSALISINGTSPWEYHEPHSPERTRN